LLNDWISQTLGAPILFYWRSVLNMSAAWPFDNLMKIGCATVVFDVLWASYG
jgi:hypothetical protein